MLPAVSRAPESRAGEDGLGQPRRAWAMLAVGLAVAMAVLDGTISNVALPTIASDLHASPAASIWVVNAYQLAITVSLLPVASFGEISGYQRVYRAGLVLFVLASLACALSASLPLLVAARILQGFGAAGIMSVNGALIRFIFPHRMLGRAIGYNAMVVAVASAAGPTATAAIFAVGSWPWLFAINVPIGVLSLAVAWRSLPVTPRADRRFDAISALLSAAAFGLLIAAIDGVGHAARAVAVLGMLAASMGCGTVLVRRQIARPAPLLPVDLLRIPIFALSIATSIASFAAQMLAFVSLPFYIQDTIGRSAVQTGLLLTPWPLTLAVVAPIAGRLSERYPAGLLGGIGLLALAGGLLLLAGLPAHPGDLALVWRLALCGAGFGLFQAPNNRTLLQSAPRSRAGGASGMLATARLLGQTSGAALVAMIFALSPGAGTRISVEVAAAFALVAALVSILRIGVGSSSTN
ncbi:MFS transporter [Lichenicoccus roseus]|uniref:MFS transporter n=2 Tax=Lichenicoccus roseus TaxID=2683649 RepID=A0A5R9J8K3_9PROT|nr:MFS transporter [Lichenicoccus roseus]